MTIPEPKPYAFFEPAYGRDKAILAVKIPGKELRFIDVTGFTQEEVQTLFQIMVLTPK